MKILSQKEIKTPLQEHYDMFGRLPTKAIPDEPKGRYEFNFNSMRTVDLSQEFDKIMSLFGKRIYYNGVKVHG